VTPFVRQSLPHRGVRAWALGTQARWQLLQAVQKRGGRFASFNLLATLPLPEAGTELSLPRTAALEPHSGTTAPPPQASFQLLREAEANAHRPIKS